MFDIGYSELLLVAIVAIVVIGPKDLPRAMRVVGNWVGRARAMTRHLRAGVDEMMRQAELEEMEKQWREHNARIMAATPTAADFEAKPAVTSEVALETADDPPPPTTAPVADEAPIRRDGPAAP